VVIKNIELTPIDDKYSQRKQAIIDSNIIIRDKAFKDKKYSDALKANAEISKLLGYYDPEKVEHTGEISFSFGGEIKEDVETIDNDE